MSEAPAIDAEALLRASRLINAAPDLETLPEEVREQVSFDLVRTMDEVMDAVFARLPSSMRAPAEPEVGVPLSHG